MQNEIDIYQIVIKEVQDVLQLHIIKQHPCYKNTGKIIMTIDNIKDNIAGVIRCNLPNNCVLIDPIVTFNYHSTFQKNDNIVLENLESSTKIIDSSIGYCIS